MSNQLIFWGATGQARVLRECLSYLNLDLVALFDNNPEICSPFEDVPLFCGIDGFRFWHAQQKSQEIFFIVAIGGNKGRERIEIQDYLENQNLIPLTAIHPTAYVAGNVFLGRGSQILARSVVAVECKLGRACIVNTGAIIDHECIIDDGVHVGPGACIAGCVEIGKYTLVGSGAVVLPRIKIGEGAIIGAGAVVTKDVPPSTVVVGSPTKRIRWREIERKPVFKRIKP